MNAVEIVLRAALTATFLLSAAGKAMALEKSSRMLSQLLPLPGRPLALGLIAAETLAAAAIATAQEGERADIGAGAALVLALLFAGASLRASLGGQALTCACFGSLRPAQVLGWHTLLRALAIAVAAAGWLAAVAAAPASGLHTADRAALSFTAAAAVASVIAWTHWRAGIPHRRFAAEAIYLQRQGAPSPPRESS